MKKFKVGDIVIVTRWFDLFNSVGAVGVVVGEGDVAMSEHSYGVDFGRVILDSLLYPVTHTLVGMLENRTGYYFTERCLQLYTRKEIPEDKEYMEAFE